MASGELCCVIFYFGNSGLKFPLVFCRWLYLPCDMLDHRLASASRPMSLRMRCTMRLVHPGMNQRIRYLGIGGLVRPSLTMLASETKKVLDIF
jgi:hypothetical protein